MKVASYNSTRKGLQGVANRIIRLRLGGQYSHTEVVFEPGDGVDHFMPDGTCEPDSKGALWCASSVAAERMPSYSPRRANSVGGVRFKRIVLGNKNWDLIDCPGKAVSAAEWFKAHEGSMYDWYLIVGYLAWIFRGKNKRFTCSEAVAAALGYQQPWRLDPCVLHYVLLNHV